MRRRETLELAFRAIRRYPVRSSLMLLATAIGVAAVVVFTALGDSAGRYVHEQFGALGTNLLQVVPSTQENAVEAADDAVKDSVERAFRTNQAVAKSGIKVSSVNKGVVLLSGSTDDIVTHLQAIEAAYAVKGVRRVSSEVTVKERSQ